MSDVRATRDRALRPELGLAGYTFTSLAHTLHLTLRRRRVLLAAAVVMLPVVVPLAVAYFSRQEFSADGALVFARLMEQLYLRVLAPLLALFFAALLVGEEVENQTIGYVLVRPIPRAAWIIGRYVAFFIVAGALLGASMVLSFTTCLPLANWNLGWPEAELLLTYLGIGLLALTAYGAVSIWLGAVFKRPIIYGVIVFFGWQNLVVQVPGLVDFLTIHKYVSELFPALVTQRNDPAAQALLDAQKAVISVGQQQAVAVLVGVVLVFVALTIYSVRRREYATASAAGQ